MTSLAISGSEGGELKLLKQRGIIDHSIVSYFLFIHILLVREIQDMHFLTCAVSGLALVPSVLSQGFPSQYQNPLTPQRSSLAIPLLGYGTWNLDKSNISEAVSIALETGYRHLDCAAAYRNEKEVGKGIAHGLAKAGISRDDIWVTSKLWNDQYVTCWSLRFVPG